MAHESKPSKTAMIVSQSVYFKSQDSILDKYAVEDTVAIAEQLIKKYHPLQGIWIWLLRNKFFGWFGVRFENIILPGFMNHVLLRKWWIQNTALGLLKDQGYFLSVGAGFDGLSVFLKRKQLALECFEMDYPQTQSLKKALVSGQRMHFCGLNWEVLQDELSKAKMSNSTGKPLVILLEGVSMYLSADEMKDLLRRLASLYEGPTFLIATAMEIDEKGKAHFAQSSNFLGKWLQKVQEPFAWGSRPSQLAEFIEPCGWELKQVALTSEVAKQLNLHLKVAQGEYIIFAQSSALNPLKKIVSA